MADSKKQTDRLENIFHDKETGIQFSAVERTIHAGFVDDDLKACFFTDHQIFDRYHKYNLRTEQTRTGKVALTLKELQQFEIGDYVVHLDHGVGRFGGLVRIPNGDKMQEVIKIIYNHDDVVFVSIHALHKVSKYKGKEVFKEDRHAHYEQAEQKFNGAIDALYYLLEHQTQNNTTTKSIL